MTDVMRNKYKELTEDDKRQMRELKDMAEGLHNYIEGLGASRSISIAKTKLEEMVMWATKHISTPDG